MKLWIPKDLAQALGIRTGVVNNWYNRGNLPEPFGHTAGGTPLWADEEALEIVEERRAHLANWHARGQLDETLQRLLDRGVKF